MDFKAQQLSFLTCKLAPFVPPGTFLSPCSIHLALALVGAGATGPTLGELQKALGWPTGQKWQEELAQLLSSLRAVTAVGEPIIAVANRVFTKFAIQPQYASAVESAFGATIEPLHSAAQVNAFVSTATRQMITQLVTDAQVERCPLIAVNAMYFKGKWAVQLNKDDTCVAPFTTRAMPGFPSRVENCHLMRTPRGKKWRYFEDARAQYVLMPYRGAGGAIAAIVALPKDVAADPLQTANFGAALVALRADPERAGVLWLPRFEVESKVELSSALEALGAPRAFSDSAEFGLIAANGSPTAPLKIDQVLHKVKVKVDEEGTVAAATTTVSMGFGGLARGPPPFQVRCNRPFAFAVVHVRSSLVLFAGSVERPGCVGDPPPAAVSQFGGPAAHAPALGTAPLSLSLGQRREQACLFTPACRRDVYRILCAAPRCSLRAASPPPAPNDGSIKLLPSRSTASPLRWVFEVGGNKSPFSLGGNKSPFSFGGAHSDAHGTRPKFVRAGSRTMATDVARTLAAIETVGQPTPEGIAFTEAFEALLTEEYVGWWEDADAATLSTAFIVAFGNELTQRLDLEHALRSRPLPPDDITWLRALPPAIVFNRSLIDTFQ